MKLQLGYKLGPQSPEGLTGTEGIASKMAYSHDYWQFPTTWSFLEGYLNKAVRGYPNHMVAKFSQSE